MDELEKKLEQVRQRRERNKVWVDSSKSNRAEAKQNKKSSEEPSLRETIRPEIETKPLIKIEIDFKRVFFGALSVLSFFPKLLFRKRAKKQNIKLFEHSESYIIACKSKILMDSKKHRAFRLH